MNSDPRIFSLSSMTVPSTYTFPLKTPHVRTIFPKEQGAARDGEPWVLLQRGHPVFLILAPSAAGEPAVQGRGSDLPEATLTIPFGRGPRCHIRALLVSGASMSQERPHDRTRLRSGSTEGGLGGPESGNPPSPRTSRQKHWHLLLRWGVRHHDK